MNIHFQKESLTKALNILQKVAQNRVNSNIPGAIYITTKNNQVELQANDFEIGIKVSIEAEIEEGGTLVLASKYFQELVKRMPNEMITLYRPEDTNTVIISSGTAEYNLVTIDPDEFTLVEQIHDDYKIDMETKDLKSLIDLTLYAVSSDESRPIFTGALLQIEQNNVTMVGTDTHRLAVKKMTITDTTSQPMNAVISARVLNEVARLLPVENPQLVTIIWNNTQVAFVFENVYMVARLIEGTFPDYEKIIPSQFFATATLNRKELIGAVERVSLLSKEAIYNAIKFEWSTNDVTLSSQNMEIGTAKETIPCTLKGDHFSISFNGRYFIDILKHGAGDNVHLYLTDRGPVVVRMDEMPNYTYVATPIRTN